MKKNRKELSIVHINTHDLAGGAAKVAWRLAETQRNAGHNSKMLVGIKKSNSEYSRAFAIEPDPARQPFSKAHGQLFYDLQGSHKLISNPIVRNADILHLHNLHGGYFNPFSLSALSHLKSLVWTLHDMQPLTGHCAHSFDCQKWQTGCNHCPYLNVEPAINIDTSEQLRHNKKLIYDHSYLWLVTPSQWLKKKVEKSILQNHPVELIYNSVNTSTFKPYEKAEVRRKFGIPEKSLVIGAVAHGGTMVNQWKGGHFTKQALEALQNKLPDYVFLNIGGHYETDDPKFINLPHISNENELAMAYSAIDIFLNTSIADNCPLVILEALSCGLPIITFATGGIPELVSDHQQGCVIPCGDIQKLVQSLYQVAANPSLQAQYSRSAREKAVSMFDDRIMSNQYEILYERVLEESRAMRNQIKHFPLSEIPQIVQSKAFIDSENDKSIMPLKPELTIENANNDQQQFDVSIVLCTKDRAQLLDEMLTSLKEAIKGVSCEIVVVEGGSSDNTRDILQKHSVTKIYNEAECLGPGRHSWPQLYNFGFSKARGKWAMYASDDILISKGCFTQAIELLDSQNEKIAGGIFFFKNIHENPEVEEFSAGKYFIGLDRGWKMVLNYGLFRLDYFRQVGGLDETYKFYCADADLGCKFYDSGKQLIPLPRCHVIHNNVLDQLKKTNQEGSHSDYRLYLQRWGHFAPGEQGPGRLIWQEDFVEGFDLPLDLEEMNDGIEYFWQGLACLQREMFRKALAKFSQAMRNGCCHWKILWYSAKAAYSCGEIEVAKKIAQTVVKYAPEFNEARQFLAEPDDFNTTSQIKNTSVDVPKFPCNTEVKDKPRKIYCVLFDTAPFFNEIVSLAGENGMTLLRQVGGCFTTTSCVEMLTGKLCSDLEKNGMGYERHNRYRDPATNEIHWPWEHELIVNRFLDHGWQISLHNSDYFTTVLSNTPAFEKTTSLPGGVQAEKEFWENRKVAYETILGDNPQSEQYYQNEIRHIHQIQSEKILKDKFYFIKYNPFHVATVEKSGKDIAARRSIELMRQWDFNEPNAIFWFFSDHGDWHTLGEHPQADHYLSWVMFRDNTANAVQAKSKFIFAGDFFPTIMDKFGYRYESLPDASPLQQPQDTERIYYTEDGRQRFDKNNSTTALACRFIDWNEGKPGGLLQVSYFKPRNEFVCLLAHLNADGFVTNTVQIDKIDERLKQALIDRFEWVSPSQVLRPEEITGFDHTPSLMNPSQNININPVSDPSMQQYAQVLRERIKQLGTATTVGSSRTEAEWVKFRNSIQQQILNEDINNFLNWDTIAKTMFHEARIEELQFLQSLPDWNRWQKAIQESSIGHPRPYPAYPESSGNLIHHAYSLAQLEQRSGCRIDRLPAIFEFGGGYGSMCRLAFQLGFKGCYIIYDLPEYTALQEYFLNCLGLEDYISYDNTSDAQTSVVLLSDVNKLAEQLNNMATGYAFVATWSISEVPSELRNRIFNLASGADYYLIAYQERFGEEDNLDYFAHIAGNRTDFNWAGYPIKHLPTHHYLIGNRKQPQMVHSENVGSNLPKSERSVGGLIFSKDRALQLCATIESFLLHCTDNDIVGLTLLYKASSPLHKSQYDDLRNRFHNITFIEEQDFKKQTLEVIRTFEYILFLVDDNLFVKDFSLTEVVKSLDDNHDAVGFSLRLGRNTDYCYMLNSPQVMPQFRQAGHGILKYSWPEQQHDFGYPLEVSSSVYRVKDIIEMLVQLEFSYPNTLEEQMATHSSLYSRVRSDLLCYESSVTFCNPVNVVQNTHENKHGTVNNYTSEELADRFSQGMVVDVEKYTGFIPNAAHQETQLYFKKAGGNIFRISVIIPCYNQARYLPEAVDSIVRQTYTNWECIIVNDGSNDNTVEVANQLIAQYPDSHIRFIDKPHSGVSDTRNMGIEAAMGEWVLPLDSDDMFDPSFMQRAVDIVKNEPNVDIVFSNMQEFGASNGQWIPDEYSRERVMIADTMPYASLYRKELWHKVGGYDKPLSIIRQPEDWSFWISCSKHNVVVKRIEEKLFFYRVHPESTYLTKIKPNRRLAWAFVATCHPDLYPPQTLAEAWGIISDCPDDVYHRIIEAIEKCPKFGLLYFWRALAERARGQNDNAIKYCSKAMAKAKENDWQAIFLLMNWQKGGGDSTSLTDYLHRLLNIRPDFSWASDLLPTAFAFHQEKTNTPPDSNPTRKILFYFDRIGNLDQTSPAGTVISVFNLARLIKAHWSNVDIHITGNLVGRHEQCESFQIIPLPQAESYESFLAQYDIVFFATHIRSFLQTPKRPGQTWFIHQHCWDFDDQSRPRLNDVDAVICLSEYHKAFLQSREIPADKLIIIPNFIDTDMYQPRNVERDDRSIMFAGGIHPHKCVHILLEAVQIIRQHVPDVTLHLYGDGSMWRGGDDYGNYLKRLKPEGVYFHGYTDHHQMPEIYSKHGIHCLPSTLESFGLVTVEAQACGCIPVVHKVGGVAATLTNGKTGFLYEPNTPEKLAETLLMAMSIIQTDPSIRQKAVNFVRETLSLSRATPYIHALQDRIHPIRHKSELEPLETTQPALENLPRNRDNEDHQESEPFVSVIMPVYNGSDYIGQAIENVLSQDYPNLELIIIDDGSTDNTKEIISRYDDTRIRYLYRENNGVSSARNLGIQQAQGSYIIPLDADDMMASDSITKHLQAFDSHPDVDLVYSDVLLIDENNNPLRIMKKPEYQDRKHLIRDLFRAGHPIVPFRLGIRRSVFDKIGFYDEKLLVGEDYDMMRRLVKAGLKIYHLGEALHLRRIQPNSLTRIYSEQKAQCHFDVVKRFVDTFTYDELFPDVMWDTVPRDIRQIHAKCLVASTYLAMGEDFLKSNSPHLYITMAYDEACAQLRECLEIDPGNESIRQLLHKCQLGKQRFDNQVQQTDTSPCFTPPQHTADNTGLSSVSEDVPAGVMVSNE